MAAFSFAVPPKHRMGSVLNQESQTHAHTRRKASTRQSRGAEKLYIRSKTGD